MKNQDRETGLKILRSLWKAPFIPKREDLFLSTFLATHYGNHSFPGDFHSSPFWPFKAPGDYGAQNSMSGLYNQNASLINNNDNKNKERRPNVLWIWCKCDDVVNERESLLDIAVQGEKGMIEGYPGKEVYPGTPCVSQTRRLLEEYKREGGKYKEVVMDCGHLPFLEREEEFNQLLHDHFKTSSE